MKLTIIGITLLLTACAAAQSSDKRFALTANSEVGSGDVLGQLNPKWCAGISLTGDPAHADYMVEIRHMKSYKLAGTGNEYSGTLFALNGDVLFQTKSHVYSVELLPSAIRDLCKAIKNQK